MNNSLPGLYSHRMRALAVSARATELNWMRLLNWSRGFGVMTTRVLATCAVKAPYGRATLFSEMLGSKIIRDENASRPL